MIHSLARRAGIGTADLQISAPRVPVACAKNRAVKIGCDKATPPGFNILVGGGTTAPRHVQPERWKTSGGIIGMAQLRRKIH